MEKSFARRLQKVSLSDVRNYMDFWGWGKIELCHINAYKERLEAIIPTNEESQQKTTLFITDNPGQNDTCTLSTHQFIYDLEVFASIPTSISNSISRPAFISFINSVLGEMENKGWKVLFPAQSSVYQGIPPSPFSMHNVEKKDDSTKIEGKYILIDIDNDQSIKSFYESYKYIARIERHRLLELFREWLIFEICEYFKKELAKNDVRLILTNWEWAQENYLFPKNNISSYDKEIRAKYSIYNIAGNEKQYEEFLQSLYGDLYSEEYIKEIYNIPPKIEYGIGSIRHIDYSSKYMNVICGERYTTNSPLVGEQTIYLMGGCVFFGYAIDDEHTVASYLQRRLNYHYPNKKIKVVNLAVWGGNIDQTYDSFYNITFHPGDIVVVSYAGLIPIGKDIVLNDISTFLSRCDTNHEIYYDGIVHCNAEGYELVAEKIEDILHIEESDNRKDKSFRINAPDKNQMVAYELMANEYVNSISRQLPKIEKNMSRGAIVMNCNPFTKGHRFLIEKAASIVDDLIVFVVEEDKSFFPFADRIELVKKGTSDIANVYIVPSGKLIISTVTFPGYFQKDNPETANSDSALDVDIFARYIAPPLGIKYRFLGEEPTDQITSAYNNTLQSILPRYGIEVVIFPRKEINSNDGVQVISASTVRRLIEARKIELLSDYVPETTRQYIINHFHLDT